jgi:hypothetical protein
MYKSRTSEKTLLSFETGGFTEIHWHIPFFLHLKEKNNGHFRATWHF